MKQITLNSGNVMPAIGLGTWTLKGDACTRAVRHAIDLGYRHIDTAQMYKNEAAVGRGLHDSGIDRDDVFITTKIWHDALTPYDVWRTTEESLRRLGLETVDLLLIHWPNPSVSLEATLEAMSDLRDDGKARDIGVSNFPVALLEEAASLASIAAVQVEYHPFLDQRPLVEAARRHGMTLTAYSPIAQGKVLDDETLQRIGEKHGKSPVQVTLRWLIQQDVVSAIPRASSKEHRAANFDVCDFRLDDDDMRAIDDLARGERLIDPDFGPDWDESQERTIS